MSDIEQELDDMDRRLDNVSSEVKQKKWQDSYNNNDDIDKIKAEVEINRQSILQQHQQRVTLSYFIH